MSDETMTSPPAWMLAIEPGRLDRRILDQDEYWVTRKAVVLKLTEMSAEHLRNVALMLGDVAMLLQLQAMADLVLGPEDAPGVLDAEIATYWLTGSCIATVAPHDWLRSTPLIRRILLELARRE